MEGLLILRDPRHAILARGYEVDTWVCNTRHMDLTWFQQPTNVLAKLKA